MDWHEPIPPERVKIFLLLSGASMVVALVARFTVWRVRRCAPEVTGDSIVLRWPRWGWVPLCTPAVCGAAGLAFLFFPAGLARTVAFFIITILAAALALLAKRDYREELRVGPNEIVRIAPSGRLTTVRWENVRVVGYWGPKFSHFFIEAGDRARTRLRISTGIMGAGDLARMILAYAPPAALVNSGATCLMKRFAQQADAERARVHRRAVRRDKLRR